MTPADVRALRADIARHRTAATPFDIVVGGTKRGEDWERERARIAALVEAGATWWIEYIPVSTGDLDAVRARVAAGPLRARP